jgi:NADPH-dependent 2,4-dienoyl-CoA reductase/sulfur reductase-like enzyme
VNRIVIVGGSLAGLSSARALRKQGFGGELVVVATEAHRPYDRPPLSKEFLAGTMGEAELALEGAEEQLDLTWRVGVSATHLGPERTVELSDGTNERADGVVIATGARPRTLPGPAPARGVHYLRTLDDARALRAELRPGARLVIIGAGFIGAEVASTARGIGVQVTVLEAAPQPLAGALGPEIGAAVAGLHAVHGVELRCGVSVVGLAGANRVTAVELADGTSVPADAVLVGIGVQPNVEWLAGSGLHLDGGVICDEYGGTGVAGVVAVGDCSAWADPMLGRPQRVEHWTAARERSAVAVATLLSGGQDRRVGRPAYFWSDQYGHRIQFAGAHHGHDEVVVEAGALGPQEFLATYRRQGQVVAALAVGHGPAFLKHRRELAKMATSAGQEMA